MKTVMSLRKSAGLLLLLGMALTALVRAPAAEAAPRAYVHTRVFEQLAEESEVRVFVSMWDANRPQAAAKDWRDRVAAIEAMGDEVLAAVPAFRLRHRYETQRLLSGVVDEKTLQQLMRCPVVAGVYPVRKVKAAMNAAGPLVGQPTAQSLGYTGAGFGIAILDTGIDYRHPELGGTTTFPNTKVVGGYNFYAGTSNPLDDNGHGTNAAGCAAGTGSTYRGIAPGAHLLALKVLDQFGSGYMDDILAGVNWCITNQHGSSATKPDFNIKAINLSLGDSIEYTDPEECDADPASQAFDDALAAGIVVLAAAGNESYLEGVIYPSCVSSVLAIGATLDGGDATSLPADGIASFSNRGELVDLFAPGQWITTTALGGGYFTTSGTSFSCPIAAGAVAVVAHKGITNPTQIAAELGRTGVQIVDTATGVGTPRVAVGRAANGTPTSGPDLIVTAVAAGVSSGLPGDTVLVDVTVKNQGDTSSTACTVAVVLSANKIISGQDTLVASVSVPSLGIGASHIATAAPGTLPNVNAGPYWLGGFADRGYAVTEKNEINNALRGAAFTMIVPLAEVVSTNIPGFLLKSVPPDGIYTQNLQIAMRNNGTVPWTAAQGFVLRSISPEGNDRWGVSQVPLPMGLTVNPSQTAYFSFNVTVPTAPAWHPCHWQMYNGSKSTYFGEIATGGTKAIAKNEADLGQDYPAVSGDTAVYEDYSGLSWSSIGVNNLNTPGSIMLPDAIQFVIDPGTGLPKPPYQYFTDWANSHMLPDISGSWVAWQVDDMPGSPYWYFQIAAFNLQKPADPPRRITYRSSDAWNACIDGKFVVWTDYRNDPDGYRDWYYPIVDNPDIYLHDLSTQQTYPLCTKPDWQLLPRVSGNLVVWEDWRDGVQADIYLYDLTVDSDGDGIPNWREAVRPTPDLAERRLTSTVWSELDPDISGRTAVWLDYERYYYGTANSADIYAMDVDTMVETAVAVDPPTTRMQPRIDGDHVVWADARMGQWDVYWQDLVLGFTIPIASTQLSEDLPDVSGRRVVYSRYRGPGVIWPVYNIWSTRLLQNASVGVHTFPDVNNAYWAWEYIEGVVANGVAKGYPDGNYAPTVGVNRAQMAIFVARAHAGGDANVPAGPLTPTFSDVLPTEVFYDYVEYCYANNIVQGFTPTIYGPYMMVTREQLAIYIARALTGGDSNVPTGPATPTFPDVAPTNIAYDHIEYCYDQGVVRGFPDGTYQPTMVVTRDQMAVYIARAFGYVTE